MNRLRTDIFTIHAQYNAKCNASYVVIMQANGDCIAKIAADVPRAIGWTYPYAYLDDHLYLRMSTFKTNYQMI